MARIACLPAAFAAFATFAAIACAQAAPRYGQSPSASHPASSVATRHHSHPAPSFAPAIVQRIVVGYVPTISYASRQPLTFARTFVPPPYFVPAASPGAPPFSFSGYDENPGWNWRRVSLQQIDAEVRAKRAAAAADDSPYRRYCPDSRQYYPEVTQCASDWLTVIGRATTPARLVFASR